VRNTDESINALITVTSISITDNQGRLKKLWVQCNNKFGAQPTHNTKIYITDRSQDTNENYEIIQRIIAHRVSDRDAMQLKEAKTHNFIPTTVFLETGYTCNFNYDHNGFFPHNEKII
jgi:hypothetical protein